MNFEGKYIRNSFVYMIRMGEIFEGHMFFHRDATKYTMYTFSVEDFSSAIFVGQELLFKKPSQNRQPHQLNLFQNEAFRIF